MRSSALAKIRTERRQQVAEGVEPEPRTSCGGFGGYSRAVAHNSDHRLEHQENETQEYYAKIRKRLLQPPLQPTNASLRVIQSILPRQPTDSFNTQTWWIIDRHYRPKLRGGATPLVSRCMKTHGWSENYARRVLAGYRQFLQLKVATQDWDGLQLEPSRDINRLWQQHILDSVNYFYDCILLCGHVLGHLPDEDEYIQERAARRAHTKKLLEQVFTEIDGEIWREIVLAQEKRNGDIEERRLSHVGNPMAINDTRTKRKEETFEGTKPTTNLTKRAMQRARSPRQEPPLLDASECKVQSPRTRFKSPTRPRPFSRCAPNVEASHVSNHEQFYNPIQKKLFPGYDRGHEAYRSPGRPKTPASDRVFSPIATSAFRAMGGDGRECRFDSPTPRDASTGRVAYEIETDWGVQSFELDEDELRMDPIDARRQGYKRSDLFDPNLSPNQTRNYRTASNVPDERKPVTIYIRDQVGVVTSSRARRSTKLARVFAAYAAAKGIKPGHLTFFLNGKLVDSSDTPETLKLRDHDKIDCVIGKAKP